MSFKAKRAFLLALVCRVVLWLALWYPLATQAAEPPDVPSLSNYGGAGLLDTRTARFYPDGQLVFTTSFTEPDDRYAITAQALSWAEFTFRYSITRGIFDGNMPLHDRSFDAKLRLSREMESFPELAIGLQDILGTGAYSGEYLVGSKRWGPFDFTLGLGWGRLGSRGTFENPFGLLSSSFRTRTNDVGVGGVPLLKSYFRGPDVGVFGGVEYKTPIENLTLKVEYSSDAYVQETNVTGKDFDFPINFGVSYRPFQWLDVGVSLMHGRYAGLRISTLIDPTRENWRARLNPPPRFRERPEEDAATILQPSAPSTAPNGRSTETRFIDLTEQRSDQTTATEGGSLQLNTRPAVPTQGAPEETRFIDLTAQRGEMSDAAEPNPGVAGASAQLPTRTAIIGMGQTPAPQSMVQGAELDAVTSERIMLGLVDQKLSLMGAGLEGDKIVILVENARYRRDSEAIARTARILSIAAPPQIEYFEITLMRAGQPLTTITLPRTEIDKLARRDGSPAELFLASDLSPGELAPLDHLQPGLLPQLGAFVYPVFRQSLFDPDNPVYVRFGVGATGGLRLTRNWFVEATVIASLYDNFDEIKRASNSMLPHVRSDIANYLKQGAIGLENLSTSYFFKLTPEVFGRVTGGYLEQMFAGIGGELLYRPFGQRWAVGVDLWTVRQRGFDVRFDLRNYQALTGHLSLYYQIPWHELQLAVSAGQYLAGDKGVTFQLSRRFSTGVQIGAWFTLTNVSAEQFGEGSFDKGIRIVIPFEWVAPFATQAGYDLGLRPIQRDGGQRLVGDTVLYGATDPSDYGTLLREWDSVFR